MKTSELTKKLKKAGCRLVGHGSEHDVWYSPLTGKSFQVPRHKSKEIKKVRRMAYFLMPVYYNRREEGKHGEIFLSGGI